jgi:hypothetical protein
MPGPSFGSKFGANYLNRFIASRSALRVALPDRPPGKSNLFRKARGEGRESVVAAIFWLKARARWKETSAHELSRPAGQRIAGQNGSRCGAPKLRQDERQYAGGSSIRPLQPV